MPNISVVGGISGLTDSGLVLQLNGANDVTVASGSSFYLFGSPVAAGASYTVSVKTQSKSLDCTLANANGTVTAGADVVIVPIACTKLPLFAFVTDYNQGFTFAYTVDDNGGLTLNNSIGGNLSGASSPDHVTTDPNGRFAYVANFTGTSVSAFTVQANGQLAANNPAGGPVAAGGNPSNTAVHPNGQLVYATNSGAGTVSAYSIGTNGRLTLIQTAPAGGGPTSIAIHPTGRYAYVTNAADATVSAFSIGTDGQLTVMTPVGGAISAGSGAIGITIDPSGRFAYVANSDGGTVSAYQITANGQLASGVSAAAGNTSYSVAVDPSGRFAYVANRFGNTINAYRIDATTGQLTANDPAGVPVQMALASSQPYFITIDPNGRFAYVAGFNSRSISIFTIDSSGQLALNGAAVLTPANTNPSSISLVYRRP